ncbi:MAG: WD40 repeat domain-containing protein [Bacteroidota bacterium]
MLSCSNIESNKKEEKNYDDISLQLKWERLEDHSAYNQNNQQYPNIKKSVISPDNKYVLSGNNMGNDVILWDAESGESIWEKILEDKTLCVGFSQNSKHAITGNSDNSAKVWNVKTGELIKALSLTSAPHNIVFSNHSSLMAICCEDGSVSVWKSKNYQLAKIISKSSFKSDSLSFIDDYKIKSVTFSPDDRFLMIADNLGNIHFWDVNNFTYQQTTKAVEEKVEETSISPNGKIFAYTFKDDQQNDGGVQSESLVLWCLTNRKEIYRHEFPSGLQSILFAPNNQFLMAYGAEGKNLDKPFSKFANTYFFKLQYNEETMDSIHMIKKSKSYLPESARFNTNGNLLITSHNDGMLRLWDVAYH